MKSKLNDQERASMTDDGKTNDGKMEPTKIVDAWSKLIGRYDFYFGTVNTKATLLTAFNTFVAGGIVIKWQDIQKAFGDAHVGFFLECIGLFVAVVASLFSLWFSFRAVNPFLESPSIPNQYHSLLFFGDVIKFEPADYLKEVEKTTDSSLLKDMIFQAHTLARGLTRKFSDLKKAIWWVLYVQIPAIGFAVLVVLTALAVDVLPKLSR